MGGISIIGPMLALAGVAAVVLVAVAIIQDLRHDKKYGYRQAFYTIVSLVGLVMTVAAVTSILSVTLKASVFPKADTGSYNVSFPPSYYRAVAPSCAKECLFTADDKLAFTQWKVDYKKWQDAQNPETKGLSQSLRQDLAASLAILVVTLPLYILFSLWMNKGAKQELQEDKRPTPLRSVYFYGVSLAGLIMAVVAASMLLNIGFKMAFNTDDTSNGRVQPMVSETSLPTEKSTIQTVIDCAAKCSFTADDVSLAKQYLVDYDTFQKGGNYNSTQTDMANTIPILLIGIPLFWFHFARIRKETSTS
jgi:hypothetical protein